MTASDIEAENKFRRGWDDFDFLSPRRLAELLSLWSGDLK